MGNDLTVHAEYIKRARTRFISCLTVISRLLLCSHARGKSRLRDTIVTSLEMHKYPSVSLPDFAACLAIQRIYNRSLARLVWEAGSHDSDWRSSSLIVRRAIPVTSIRRFSNSANPRGHSHSLTPPDKLNRPYSRRARAKWSASGRLEDFTFN